MASYALLGDCHSAALVSSGGSIDWWCAPRFDSRSAFARLLDPDAGHWSIRPAGAFDAEREYVPGTMVVQTTFRTATGVAVLTDALALEPGARGHDLGVRSPHALVRGFDVVEGSVAVEIEFAPRLEYGLVVPRLVEVEAGLRTVGGPDGLRLTSETALTIDAGTARGEVVVEHGAALHFVLQHGSGLDPTFAGPPDGKRALEDAIEAWRSWAELHDSYDGAYRAEVHRSGIVLRALTYVPSGAVVAAPTTSLPEVLGGDLNWDYRYVWLRDASLTLKALWVAACPDEAEHYFGWMARAAGGYGDGHVQVMFGVEGERDLTEHELEHLAGYRGSAPVRVGNDAWTQTQLDVYGEVLEAAWFLRDQLEEPAPETARFLCELANTAAARWRETDAGIWEGREGERHYLSSKLLCWVALDRAVKLAGRLGTDARPEVWAAERDAVSQEILEQGWNEDLGAYTGAFGSNQLDASALLLSVMGFTPAPEQRLRRTIDTIERELAADGLVRRWTDAKDGAFFICSFWLANALARGDEAERARAVFDAAIAHANDVGLLSEELDLERQELIGNFPQTFSHVGL
ncbi:MAG: glycoside hydrolase family 15 protein, partial [Actinobacteria bacterium]|nr:glycoside hydrolase family 15 protein [Actinomycetota bacterium]